MSYYNREWRGNLELSVDGRTWVLGSERPFNSVEAGLALVGRLDLPGHYWRIVDVGGNVYETGRFPDADATVKTQDGNVLYVDFKTRRDRGVEMTPEFVRAMARQMAAYSELLGLATDIEKGRITIKEEG